ncbi:MAG: polysaccharide biosynthesis tyrosine autokinase [Gemmatimonadales bacterium]|nr:polysaccharide biosynthesis tyrosine autokinase [Gemmatimonadales bacterium]
MTQAGLGPALDDPGSGKFLRIFSAIRRFAWLIVLVTVAGATVSVLATRMIEKEFEVSGTIYIKNDRSQNGGPIQAPELLSSSNWIELLKSYAVLEPVVNKLKLYLLPGQGAAPNLFADLELSERFLPGQYILSVDDSGRGYSLKNNSGLQLSAGALTDSVGREAGLKWMPGPQKLAAGMSVSFSLLSPRDASAQLKEDLEPFMPTENGNFLELKLKGTDPQLLASTMQAIQEQFLKVAADLKKQKLRELSSLLADQVSQQEKRLRAAEQGLASFRVATITQPRENVAVASGLQMTEQTAYGRYFDQRVQLETVRNDRRAIEDVLRRLTSGEIAVDAFQTISSVRSAPELSKVLAELTVADAELRALRTKYTDEFKGVKDLQDRVNTLRSSTIPAYARALARQLAIQEGDLDSRINSAGEELKGIPVRTITEGRLERELESAKILYINLQSRYEETKLAEISAIPDVSVLDHAAVPTRPLGNQASKIITMGFLASLGLGLGLAVLLDRMDRRFRYPDQASHELGLTILGAVPAIPRSRNGKAVPSDHLAQVVEAFRSIRLNLAHSFEPGSPICITVSSPSPGDGKSLISSNLGLSFAEAGYRTILIDGDTRRGDLHRTFGAERRPGLLDYLGNPQVSYESTLRPTSHRNLTMIPCGTRLQHGPELLGSARMAELIGRLKSQYEVVLVDSPPLGAGIDPFVLGTHTGNMLIVLRSGETDRQMAEAKLRILDRLPVRVLGAVLNHIHAGAGAYKYYSYSYGYAAEDEIEGQEEPKGLTQGAKA